MIGIRGAIRVDDNSRDAVYRGTQRLLREIVERNGLDEGRVVSAFFTMTPDLNADFPAYAARQMGWTEVPMLGAQETAVPGALDRTVRVLLLADASEPARHVYLGEAATMRPDLVEEGDATPDLEVAGGTDPTFGPLLVVGLGLIGGSVALATRRSGLFSEVLGHDLAEESLDRARRAGAVDRASSDPAELLDRAGTVLLAIPVGAIREWLGRWGGRLDRGTVVVDVGSTKREIVEAMEDLRAGVEAVGAHPMAGTEESGMGAARPDLFHGARWALVETGRTGDRARRVVRSLVDAVGGVPHWTEASSHDAAAARTSHLPYLASVALARHVVEGTADGPAGEDVRALVGPGLRDMSRLAASDAGLMADILVSNWTEVRGELERYRSRLEELSRRIDAAIAGDEVPAGGRAAAVARLLEAGRRARASLISEGGEDGARGDGAAGEDDGDRSGEGRG